MRVEEKAPDGLELEREEELAQSPLEHREDELPEMVAGEIRDIERERSSDLLAAMQAILDDRELSVARLDLPQREAQALEALQVAVTGEQPELGTFVYAEDRTSLLEQALAILQPVLTAGDHRTADLLARDFEHMLEQVHALRMRLLELEDAQEEVLAEEAATALAHEDASDDDKQAPKRPDDYIRKPTKPAAKRATAGSAADAGAVGPRASTLTAGPDVTRTPARSTLSDGPAVEDTRSPSALTGGTEVTRSATPSSLGDPKEIAAAQAALPWWRRSRE